MSVDPREAAAVGYHSAICPHCHGRGYMAWDDPNAPTGRASEPCECLPTNRMWVHRDGDRPPLSDKQMLALIAARRGSQATTS
jgi:hypothetical protein